MNVFFCQKLAKINTSQTMHLFTERTAPVSWLYWKPQHAVALSGVCPAKMHRPNPTADHSHGSTAEQRG